jgi:hypothetical protein
LRGHHERYEKTARNAGLLYLAMAVTGAFTLMYVPGKLIVAGDASKTVANLLAHESLVRFDLAVGLITTTLFLFSALALYQLLKDVNRQHAALMVILVMVQVPQSFVTELLQMGALELARGADFLSAIDQSHRETLAMLCVRLNSKSAVLSEFLWGVWLFPLAVLVYRSGFLPRFLGVWLFINGVAYVAMSFLGLFTPEYSDAIFKFAFPAMLGELALTAWLLFVGFRSKPLRIPGQPGAVSE